MSMQQIIETVRGFEGALVVEPRAGDGVPEHAIGDTFFYYAPDGVMPKKQPYATIVTKDYPDDETSRLGDGRWRVNINVGRRRLAELVDGADPAAPDVLVAHPLYGALGWVAVVNPGVRTLPRVLELVREAHDAERRRMERRATASPQEE